MRRGKYIRDFYLLPTILIHNSDGIYLTVELVWLNVYVTLYFKCMKEDK